MKERIINKSIEFIHQEGLKFSVDDLATSLNISKKTIYKYFHSKEDLASAVYKKVFERNKEKIQSIHMVNQNDLIEILNTYNECLKFINPNLFNRFSLNDSIKKYGLFILNSVWKEVYQKIKHKWLVDDEKTLEIIINHSLEKIIVENRLEKFVGIILGGCRING